MRAGTSAAQLLRAGTARQFSNQRKHYSMTIRRLLAQNSSERNRRFVLRKSALTAFSAACLLFAGWTITNRQTTLRLDARQSATTESLTSGAKVQINGQDHADVVEKVATGTSTVPHFPRSIWLPRSGSKDKLQGKSMALPAGIGILSEEEEYQLLGLGVRTVSFFGIEVYVVGYYVAKSDMAKLQAEFVRASVGEGPSTLVQGEKDSLRRSLLDGHQSEEIWNAILKNGGVRSAFRIVPVKNTNFGHLRDGWLRGIDARGKGPEFEDAEFRSSVATFKSLMGGQGSVAKGRVLLLGRDQTGPLEAWVEQNAAKALPSPAGTIVTKGKEMTSLGRLQDERISRLVWMGYLAGASPASETARQSVVDGVIEIVGRPIGTVETQVV